jgi:DNA-directed RNA polymerase specialized sigma24 family protein
VKRRDEPCLCGWKYEGYHLCTMTLSPDPVLTEPPKPKQRKQRMSTAGRSLSESHRRAISSGMKARSSERDREVIRLYNEEELTVREIQAINGMDHKTILTILHEARDAGKVVIRPAAKRLKNVDRDLEIIRLYSEEEKTVAEIAALYEIDGRSVRTVLYRARDNGKIELRPSRKG